MESNTCIKWLNDGIEYISIKWLNDGIEYISIKWLNDGIEYISIKWLNDGIEYISIKWLNDGIEYIRVIPCQINMGMTPTISNFADFWYTFMNLSKTCAHRKLAPNSLRLLVISPFYATFYSAM